MLKNPVREKRPDLPFEPVGQGKYGVGFTVKYEGCKPSETTNHACYGEFSYNDHNYKIAQWAKQRLGEYSCLSHDQHKKWFKLLNDAYGVEVYKYNARWERVKINFEALFSKYRRTRLHAFAAMMFVRQCYEHKDDGNTVLGTIYLKEKYPDADFLNCFHMAYFLSGRGAPPAGHSIISGNHGLSSLKFKGFVDNLSRSTNYSRIGSVNIAVSGFGKSRRQRMSTYYKSNLWKKHPEKAFKIIEEKTKEEEKEVKRRRAVEKQNLHMQFGANLPF